MAILTPTTLVSKTVTVGSFELSTPADRIGVGFTVVATDPAEVLSPGQFPLPHNPEPEPNTGSRQEPSVMQMREHMHRIATAAASVSGAGCLCIPGSSAVRAGWSSTALPLAGWRCAAKPAGRACSHAAASLLARIGSDCQSPDRRDDRWPASLRGDSRRGACDMAPASVAGK